MNKYCAALLLVAPFIAIFAQNPRPVAALAGHVIYQCSYKPNQGELTFGPEYQDILDGDGHHVNPAGAYRYFEFGNKLTILSATTGENLRGADFPQLFLKVRNETNKATATLPLEVSSPEKMKTTLLILRDIGTGAWFSLHPVPDFPKLGMTEADVDCSVGYPDHTNTDARGDDQLVYQHGNLLVYINKAGRVSDIQTSN
jgi:hypothetical protein